MRKATVCLWFDKSAHEAASFYAATFPDSHITRINSSPMDGQGHDLTVEFTVCGRNFCSG